MHDMTKDQIIMMLLLKYGSRDNLFNIWMSVSREDWIEKNYGTAEEYEYMLDYIWDPPTKK